MRWYKISKAKRITIFFSMVVLMTMTVSCNKESEKAKTESSQNSVVQSNETSSAKENEHAGHNMEAGHHNQENSQVNESQNQLPPGHPPLLKKVETKFVCMVNNKLFQKEQIPVVFEGKTYYGCCEGCVATLQTKKEARESTDPVTGEVVDKVDAIKGALPDGRILYFASNENFEKYKQSLN